MTVILSPLKRPHMVLDLLGRIVSCAEVEKIEKCPIEDLLNAEKKRIGKIQCLPTDRADFDSYFKNDDSNFPTIRERWESHSELLINKDLESILYLAATQPLHLDQLLYKCCLYLRSYILAENCSVFGMPDGCTFMGLMAVFPNGKKDRTSNWNTSLMNIAGIAIQEKRPYVCNNTQIDPNFKKYTGEDGDRRNMVCFPILNGGQPIGVINVSNKMGGEFTSADLRSIERFSTVISHLLQEEFERQQREKYLNTSAQLSKYLSGNVVRQIATSGTSGGLGGTTKKVVVLFSDIRSFTTISEGLAPATLVKLLNSYFQEMSTVIDHYNGTLDKLVGDMMMVLWNIPVDQPEPELLAMKAAMEMQKVVAKKVAPEWAKHGVSNFGIGIGLNSGPAVAGNLGCSRFMNYTVIGETINTAQRIESKARAGEIWVHQDMMPAIDGKVIKPVRVEQNLALKGVTETITAYVFMPPKVPQSQAA